MSHAANFLEECELDLYPLNIVSLYEDEIMGL